MAELILITGGARSGKSRFAEDFLRDSDRVIYLATARVTDAEMEDRIRQHRIRRNPAWRTLEAWEGVSERLAPLLAGYDALLLDCVTIMITNQMLADPELDWDTLSPGEVAVIEKKITLEFSRLLTCLKGFPGRALFVTNELGMGLVPSYPLGRHFRDIAGRINQQLAAVADSVYLLVSGIPLRLKGDSL